MSKHFYILRRLAIEFLVVWVGLFVLVYWKIDIVFHVLLQQFDHAIPIVASQILSPILIPLDLAIDASLFMAIPFAIYQIWRFVAPALFNDEKQAYRLILCLSLSLLILGLVFCWFWVLPFLFSILNHGLPQRMVWMPAWQSYYEFILLIETFFGFAFQMPLVMVILVRLNVISNQQLVQSRRYAMVIAFVLGMLVTPPDVGSQILVAIPLCLLYELGIRLAMLLRKKITLSNNHTFDH